MKPKLQSLIFEVTPRCNHACLHCYNIWAAPETPPYPAPPHPTLPNGKPPLERERTFHPAFPNGKPPLERERTFHPAFPNGKSPLERGRTPHPALPNGKPSLERERTVHPALPNGKPPLERGKNRGVELDTASTLALLAKALAETDCPHVTLTGGEPLLRRDLPQIIDFLAARNTGVTIITNGRLLSEPVVTDLLERGVSMFEIPLLSYRRNVHDQLSGAAGAFDAALAAMARIRAHGGKFVAVFVATRLNLPDLYDTIRLAYAFGARGLMLNRFNVGGRGIAHVDELLPSAEELRLALEIAEKATTELGFSISCSIPIQPCLIDTSVFPHLGFGYCAAGTRRAYYTLDPLGNLRPCNHTLTILGNLFDEPFDRLISSERMAGFCQALPDFCQSCSQRTVCQGGCKAAAQVCFGSLTAEEPFLRYNQAVAKPLVG